MLDRAMSHSVVHCYKKGHLGLCLSLEAMDQLASTRSSSTQSSCPLVEAA